MYTMKKSIFILAVCAACACSSFAEPKPPALIADHPWKGRTVAFLGDSMTDPWHIGTTRNYWQDLGDWLHLEYTSFCQNGRQWTVVTNQAVSAVQKYGEKLDAIFILMGTNDFIDSVPLGEWYVEKDVETIGFHGEPVTRKHREFNLDSATFRGRINAHMRFLKSMYPDLTIILITPVHRAYASWGGGNVQQDEMYQNGCGQYHEAYVQAVREAGPIWSVPVIDLYSLSGNLPTLPEHHKFIANPPNDCLHPNAAGHNRIARAIYAQLITLPIL